MAKTIKITLYTPRELWRMFWNWAFWPRRKKCAEWMELLQYKLERDIVTDLLIGKYYEQGILNEAVCESLELDIKGILKKTCKEASEIISKPLND